MEIIAPLSSSPSVLHAGEKTGAHQHRQCQRDGSFHNAPPTKTGKTKSFFDLLIIPYPQKIINRSAGNSYRFFLLHKFQRLCCAFCTNGNEYFVTFVYDGKDICGDYAVQKPSCATFGAPASADLSYSANGCGMPRCAPLGRPSAPLGTRASARRAGARQQTHRAACCTSGAQVRARACGGARRLHSMSAMPARGCAISTGPSRDAFQRLARDIGSGGGRA